MKLEEVSDIIQSIDNNGFAVIESVYSEELMLAAINGAEQLLPFYKSIQKNNGVGAASLNSTHHTLLMSNEVLQLINPNPTNQILKVFFDGHYILNTMGVAFCQPNLGYNYTNEIHRDIRSYSSNNRLYINGIILLDDSTEENGATHMIFRDHNMNEKPTNLYFDKHSFRITGKRGDVILFDGNMWHKAGVNSTSKPRRIISQMFTKPFIKQQLDYPRAFGNDFKYRFPKELSQILGYNARVPSSLDEFYGPEEKRFYKSDQG